MKLQDVNTTDIPGAIELGCRTMSSVFNADDNDIAFFTSYVRPEPFFAFSAAHSESHIPGRHLNALLNAEDALGLRIPDEVIEKHSRAAYFSYSGPLPLPLNRAEIGGPLINFYPHNIREGFLALYALTAFRNSERARDLAEASIAAIFDLWDAVQGWDWPRIERESGLRHFGGPEIFISGLARAIGPLVRYHRATDSPAALQLATMLKDKALSESFTESGECDFARMGTHSHSITCVMSSLAQFAELTRDATVMNRVKAFYDYGLQRIRNQLGWSPENTAPDAPLDRGEANNSGDIVETALILGRWGYTEYYHDAERILRCHLLPSQLRDISFIRESADAGSVDANTDVAERHLGAFGFPAPYGHQPVGFEHVSFNMDIVGGVVGSLCEVWREAVRSDKRGHFVNLLFDRETDALSVRSPYTSPCLQVTVKRPAPLWIRIPPWASRADVLVSGAVALPQLVDGYLYIEEPPAAPITIDFPLARQEVNLNYLDRRIRARLRGDEVLQMENTGADLTFFDPLTGP